MSLPLAAICWVTCSSGMLWAAATSTRSIGWVPRTWASSSLCCGRVGRTAMPLLRSVLTMVSAFSPLSSTISRRTVMSFAFCIQYSPDCKLDTRCV